MTERDFCREHESKFVTCKIQKKIVIFFCILLILCIGAGLIDYSRVHKFEKPWFCVITNGYDDGGSGTYVGLGYSFGIEGNFMPEDELQGVTKYVMKILGITIASGVRD